MTESTMAALLSEYLAIRERVGISDLSGDGQYLLSGEDKTSFLQNLISNDLYLAQGNRGIYTTLLTAKGRIIADFYLYPFTDAYLLTMESIIAEKTFQHLMRFRFRSKINIVNPQWRKILVAGPQARPLLQRLFKDALPEMEECSIVSQQIDPVVCVRQSQTGEEEYHLYCKKDGHEAIWAELLSLGKPFGVETIGPSALELLRMEAGIPRYGVDLTEEILPIEARLEDRAISYTKGCYPGQEVIARIKTYGHVNKRRMGLLFNGNDFPSAGEKVLRGDTQVGWITAGAFSLFLKKGIATAYIRTVAATAGTQVDVGGDIATITNLPFYCRR
ncbi:MAG: aminomethyl transferase family protein [Nitrospirae bacterium]|nr:aminomethyl transferase family protein [Candidatus Troglogloeales bacterium]